MGLNILELFFYSRGNLINRKVAHLNSRNFLTRSSRDPRSKVEHLKRSSTDPPKMLRSFVGIFWCAHSSFKIAKYFKKKLKKASKDPQKIPKRSSKDPPKILQKTSKEPPKNLHRSSEYSFCVRKNITFFLTIALSATLCSLPAALSTNCFFFQALWEVP